MNIRVSQPLDADETARLVAAVAYATQRAALERRAKAAVKARRFDLVAKLAQEARELDAQAFGK